MAPARRSRTRLHLTGTGGWTMLTTLALAAAAANTANNLLYLLLALLLAAYPASAWLARRQLARASGELLASRELVAGEPAEVLATVTASSPTVGLVLALVTRAGAASTASAARAVRHLGRDQTITLGFGLTPERRGRLGLALVARCPFPFGLIEGARTIAEDAAIVLPAPDPSWRTGLPPSASEGGAAPRRGHGAELFDIRDHQHGDDARHVDWKASARLQRLMVREHARDEERACTLVVDPALPAVPTRPLLGGEADVETAISRAAGAVIDLSREGWRLRLLAPGVDVQGDPRGLLRALALLETTPSPWPPAAWHAQVAEGETVLAFAAAAGLAGVRVAQGAAR